MNPLRDPIYDTIVKEVWANPQGDRNGIFKSTKLTTSSGAIGIISFNYDEIKLPDNNNRYIVIELGGIPANLIGLKQNLFYWRSLQSVCDELQILITAFCQGRMLTKYGSYIQITSDNNVLLAFRFWPARFITRLNDDIYVRFYTNIIYSGGITSTTKLIKSESFVITDSKDDYIHFFTRLNTYSDSNNIIPIVYKNGLYKANGFPGWANLNKGDIIDYIGDPNIVAFNEFTLLTMDGYFSDLDNANKILASVDSLKSNSYVDDIEVYITGTRDTGGPVGVYFPRLSPSVIRMLTYKDWGLDSLKVDARLQELSNFSDVNEVLTDVKVHVFRRNTDQLKNTFLDSNYIIDLMNLPIFYRKQAISGVNATLPLWQANTLEQAPFNTWIATETKDLINTGYDNVFSRYGIISCYEHVRLLYNNTKYSLPLNAKKGGLLLKYNYKGANVILANYDTDNHVQEEFNGGIGVELFYPEANLTSPLDIVLNANDEDIIIVNKTYNLFCYYLQGGILHLATQNIDYTLEERTNGVAVLWDISLILHRRFIRISNRIVAFTINITFSDIINGIDVYNGRDMENDIGMECLLVWYRDRYMVEGLDYQLLNSKIYFTSKPPDWDDHGELTVIYAGLPDPSFTHVNKNDWGFIKYGAVSNDNVYDLMMDRNKRFFINGRAVPFEEVRFEENYRDKDNLPQFVIPTDGWPYAVIKPPVFSRDQHIYDLSTTKTAESTKEQTVMDYVNSLYAQSLPNGIITIPEKYELISIFLNKVINYIVNDIIEIDPDVTYDEATLLTVLNSILYLRDIDPCLQNHDLHFVTISPRWITNRITITALQFDFLETVNRILLGNLVEGLSLYFNIVP